VIAQFSCDIVRKNAVVLVLLEGKVGIRDPEHKNNLPYVSTHRDGVRVLFEML